ncbi:hypothetical protein [Paenibacillus sanguinis]|uniref:hypothetical protein n=1 Tax=Paenibacillus sanguinis TaxID=225906 RepID=UPI00037FF937|nr:hypothetical protein [Paenibacillus sanguinis]
MKNFILAVNLMSSSPKKKILVLVEGERTDYKLMSKLIGLYPELDAKYQIVSYHTNIYVLYQEFFTSGEHQDNFDLLQVLKSRESDFQKKYIFDDRYTDILLIFDLDPHDPLFSEEKIKKMQNYFCESSDMGKLYLNYPMVESFYHMNSIPDPEYNDRTVSMDELRSRSYKARVNRESMGRNYQRFAINRVDCGSVIVQNIQKAKMLLGENTQISSTWSEIDSVSLLNKQLEYLRMGYLYVLCTCAMFIYDYDSRLLDY